MAAAVRSFCVHASVALLSTYPLVLRLQSGLPVGTESSATVPLFNLWTLRWNATHLLPFGDTYWNAPIFAPTRGTFAWSEPQPFTGWLFAVLRLPAGDVAGYNLVLLLSLALVGIAGTRLARATGADGFTPVVIGVWCQLLPFLFGQLGVLQLTMVWPLLLVLSEVAFWLRQPTVGRAARLGLWMAIAVLTCGNLALLFAICVGCAGVTAISRQYRAEVRQRVGGLCVAAAVLAAIAGPIAIAQQEHLSGRRWREATVLANSATGSDWWFGGKAWPGIILLAAACCGAWVARRQPFTRFLAAVVIVGVVLSFGVRLSLLGVHPWRWMSDRFDALARLRSPWRAAAIVQIALIALAAPAVGAVVRWRRVAGPMVAVAAVAVAAVVGPIGSGRLARVQAIDSPVVTALASVDDLSPVVATPFAPGPAAADFEATVAAMLSGLEHGHPLVNGYSGFFPSDHALLRARLSGFPDAVSIGELHRRGVNYVLADLEWFISRQLLLRQFGINTVVVGDHSVLLELPS